MQASRASCFAALRIFSVGAFVLAGCSSHQGYTSLLSTQGLLETKAIVGSVALENNPNLASGLPLNQKQKSEIFISRPEYVISWNKENRSLNWAAWLLEAHDLGKTHRTNSFAMDTDLDGYLSKLGMHAVSEKDYSGSCFDRGHQVPSADRTASVDENTATFLMSNMLPQTAFLNRVIWEHLETHERSMVKDEGLKIQIFAGPLYSSNPTGIGPNADILIPSFNYKIIVPVRGSNAPSRQDPDMIVVKMPNVTSANTDPVTDHAQECADSHSDKVSPDLGSSDDWKQYQTTLDEVESLSGFRFFP